MKGKPPLRIPTLVALVPFRKRIDIIGDTILIDGKPLEERIRSEKKRKAYRYLIKKLGVKRYGISRFGLYKKLRRLGLDLKKLRLYALEMVKNDKKLLRVLLSIWLHGSFRREIAKRLAMLSSIIRYVFLRIISIVKGIFRSTPRRISLDAL